MKRNRTAVIGLGNRLLLDEGAGLHAIDSLKEKFNRENRELYVDLVEAGTPGMNLLHQFDEREKIIFIDAGNCGLRAGEYRRFLPDEAVSVKKSQNYSLHQFDLIHFLEFARRMDISRDTEVVIYCIQAAEIGASETLSPPVKKNLPLLVQEVYKEILDRRPHSGPGFEKG